MMKHWLIAVAALLLTAPGFAFAWEKVPATGTVHVKFLAPRNAPILVTDQGFYFVIDSNVPIGTELSGCNGTYGTFLVPKSDPAGSGLDNPAYRDTVSTLMLVYITGRPVDIYVDSCVHGYPRVVGLDTF